MRAAANRASVERCHAVDVQDVATLERSNPRVDERVEADAALFPGGALLGRVGLAGLRREAGGLVAALFPVGRLAVSVAVPHTAAAPANVEVALVRLGLPAIAALEVARALFHVFHVFLVGCLVLYKVANSTSRKTGLLVTAKEISCGSFGYNGIPFYI